ncbi:HU family DNA-binding protein [Geothrix limicola]|nr:HU family DNA-binding protein [Geothrix limicola]
MMFENPINTAISSWRWNRFFHPRGYNSPISEVLMNKAELVSAVADKAGITKAQAAAALDQVLGGIAGALRAGDKVTLVGFGTFSVANRGARTGRNPRDNKPIKIAAKKVAKFKPGKKLADEVNGKGGKKRK